MLIIKVMAWYRVRQRLENYLSVQKTLLSSSLQSSQKILFKVFLTILRCMHILSVRKCAHAGTDFKRLKRHVHVIPLLFKTIVVSLLAIDASGVTNIT